MISMYHVSSKNHDNQIFKPRKINGYAQKVGVESKTARVCFSPTIDQCLTAILGSCVGYELYVHVPTKPIKNIYYATTSDVYDANVTQEIRALEKVKMKCIGKIFVYDIDKVYKYYPEFNKKNKYGCVWLGFKYKWYWSEIYENY